MNSLILQNQNLKESSISLNLIPNNNCTNPIIRCSNNLINNEILLSTANFQNSLNNNNNFEQFLTETTKMPSCSKESLGIVPINSSFFIR